MCVCDVTQIADVTRKNQIDTKYSAKVDVWALGAIAYTLLGVSVYHLNPTP